MNEKSAQVQFVNTRLLFKRTRKLKNYSELKLLDSVNPDSDDMFTPSLIDAHYPDRPDELSPMCLHDFAKYIDWYHRNEKGDETYRRLAKPRGV